LFQYLVVWLQTLALQQMGKFANPITDEVERDLHQAKITVDMLGMIQTKTDGNLDDNEKRFLDTVLMELQMNYIDENAREESGDREEKADKETEQKNEGDPDAGGGEEEPDGEA
jgi:hypothetical protein